jgi:hypothetical protein
MASKLDQDMTQLSCRQAGPDNRTVQVGGKSQIFRRPAAGTMFSFPRSEKFRSASCGNVTPRPGKTSRLAPRG